MYLVGGRVTAAANPPAGREGVRKVRAGSDPRCVLDAAGGSAVPPPRPVLAAGTTRAERSSCKGRRQRQAGTPASFIGTPPANNRTALVSAPLCWACLRGWSWARRDSVPSSAPAAAQHEHAPIVYRDGFPAGRKKCSDFPSPQLQKGLVTRAKLLSFTVSSRLKFMGRNFSWVCILWEA